MRVLRYYVAMGDQKGLRYSALLHPMMAVLRLKEAIPSR
jgi:hypothetical protein